MDTLRDLDLVRAIARPVGLRVNDDESDDGRIGTLFGHSTVFGVWYEIDSWFEGKFLERVAQGAAAKTIRESGDQVKVMFNHGRDMTINQKVLGVHEELREDDMGVYYQVPLLDTSYNRDLLPGLRSGAYGSSFMFRVIQDSWNDEPEPTEINPKGIPERTITEYHLYEHGPVTFPANPAASSGARDHAGRAVKGLRVCSMTDEYHAALRDTNPDAFDALATRARTLRTPNGAALQHPQEPARPLPGSTSAERRRRLAHIKGVLT